MRSVVFFVCVFEEEKRFSVWLDGLIFTTADPFACVWVA